MSKQPASGHTPNSLPAGLGRTKGAIIAGETGLREAVAELLARPIRAEI